MKRRATHHCCTRGKVVRLLLASGEVVEGRFCEERSQSIVVTVDGKNKAFRKVDVLSFGIKRK